MNDWVRPVLAAIGREAPVLLAGPTASGKSALALRIAEDLGGEVINADALQVFSNWRILTARPTPGDEARARHHLYGHVAGDAAYSVGRWLRDLAPLLDRARPIIVGGTGLYFSALTTGLADIPETPPEIRSLADSRLDAEGSQALLAELDPDTADRIDRLNPVRIQRAWEVAQATGRGLADWQDDTGPALLPPNRATTIVLSPDRDALAARIERRFDAMLAEGVLDEVLGNAPGWQPILPSSRAIGAAELIGHIRGDTSLDVARDRTLTQTRQYAKRQRSWFRSRMSGWRWVSPS